MGLAKGLKGPENLIGVASSGVPRYAWKQRFEIKIEALFNEEKGPNCVVGIEEVRPL